MKQGLLRYARSEFLLGDPVEGGGTFRDHAIQLEKSGRHVEELHPEPPPSEVAHILFYWYDMSKMRGSGGFGPSTLDPNLIMGWQEMRSIKLLPVELDMILSLENAYMLHLAKRLKKPT